MRTQWIKFIFCSMTLLIFSSCSYLTRRSATNDEEMVPKVQYDQLKQRYDELTKQMNQSPPGGNLATSPFEDASSSMVESTESKDKGAEVSEVVDVVPVINNQSGSENNTTNLQDNHSVYSSTAEKELPLNEKSLDGEVSSLEDSILKIKNGDFLNAENNLEKLKSSNSLQIKVRARYYLAEIQILKQNYSGAMSDFEDIIKKFAFSGMVIPTLDRLIECSSKLGMKEKYEQYYSMRHDIFGT